jgi:excisionase family DNA binding protein
MVADGILTLRFQSVKFLPLIPLMRCSTRTDKNCGMNIERKTISIMKACELVGVSRRTIYNWIAGGKVEYVRTAGGSVRIFVDTLWREPGHMPTGFSRKEIS